MDSLYIKYSVTNKKIKKEQQLTGLNGLKALAIIIILIYHFIPDKFPGGFLAVDLFFVITGYLTTEKMLRNPSENSLNMVFKRISRLFPTLFFMILTLSCILITTNKSWFISEWKNMLFSLFFLSNWWLIFNKNDYFDNFNISSPVKHLWYISLDIQFFIIYSLILKKVKTRTRLRKVLLYLSVFSVLSIILVYYLGAKENISIIYYSLPTRLYALTIGSLYGVYFSKEKLIESNNIFAYILLIAAIVSMKYVDINNELLYKYGLVSLYSIIFGYIVISLAKSDILGYFEVIGKKSYQIYIWHYMIIILSTPFAEYARPNFVHIIARVILIIIICVLFDKISKKAKRMLKLLMILYFLAIFLFTSAEPLPYRLINENETGTKILKIDTEKVKIEKKNEAENINIKRGEYKKILIIGDSVSINIAYVLGNVYPNITVDGQVGRQMSDADKVADNYISKFNNDKTAVIIMLGTNGKIKLKDIEKLSNKFSNADLYFVNINVPRPWLNNVNETLEEAKSIYNVRIIDWYLVSKEHDEYFKEDKIHVNEKGAEVLINLIINKLERNIKEVGEDIKPKIIEVQKKKNKPIN